MYINYRVGGNWEKYIKPRLRIPDLYVGFHHSLLHLLVDREPSQGLLIEVLWYNTSLTGNVSN